jgi:hypothetical protein
MMTIVPEKLSRTQINEILEGISYSLVHNAVEEELCIANYGIWEKPLNKIRKEMFLLLKY